MTLQEIIDTMNRIEGEHMKSGKFIDGGFASFIAITLVESIDESLLDDFRDAFFAGAIHIIGVLTRTGAMDDSKENVVLETIYQEASKFIAAKEAAVIGKDRMS